jgi:hypothetical protein
MINVSVKQLLSAIEEADVFKFPSMSAGADYIYNNIYSRLTRNLDVRLSDIDFSAFELDDVDTMRDIYFNILEANENRAVSLADTLRKIPPVVTASAFV